jgi:hypothetical protein
MVSVGISNRRLVNLVIARLARMVSKKRHEGLYWFGHNVPTSSSSHLCACTRFAAGVTNRRERDMAPKSLMGCARASVSPNLRGLPLL